MYFSESDFRRELMTKTTIKIRWKISSPRTNNRNIYFCILGPLVWKQVCHKDHCVQNSEGSVNDSVNYHAETILSTDGRGWRLGRNITWPPSFLRITKTLICTKIIYCWIWVLYYNRCRWTLLIYIVKHLKSIQSDIP